MTIDEIKLSTYMNYPDIKMECRVEVIASTRFKGETYTVSLFLNYPVFKEDLEEAKKILEEKIKNSIQNIQLLH